MSEALTIRDGASLEEIADQYGVSVQVAAEIINAAVKDAQEVTKARARVAFHGNGVNKLIELSESDDHKVALPAITLLGKLAGEFKAPRPVALDFSELIKRAQTSAGPLSNITQIREAEAIDAEDYDDGDDTD